MGVRFFRLLLFLRRSGNNWQLLANVTTFKDQNQEQEGGIENFLLPTTFVFWNVCICVLVEVFLREQSSPYWRLSSSWDMEAATNYYSLSLYRPGY